MQFRQQKSNDQTTIIYVFCAYAKHLSHERAPMFPDPELFSSPEPKAHR